MARSGDLYSKVLSEVRNILADNPNIHAKEASPLIATKFSINPGTAQTYFYKAVKEIGTPRPPRMASTVSKETAKDKAIAFVASLNLSGSVNPKEIAGKLVDEFHINENSANTYAYAAIRKLGLTTVANRQRRAIVSPAVVPAEANSAPVTEINVVVDPEVTVTPILTVETVSPDAALAASMRVQTKPDKDLHNFTAVEMGPPLEDEDIPAFLRRDFA